MSGVILESVRLLFQQGSSDKEYRVQLVKEEGGHLVNFQYGRRDAALKAGTKTAAPLEESAARKIYDKLVASKTSEGYTSAEGRGAFQGTTMEERVSGVLPQLLNPITEDELEALLQDDEWVAQQKYDGERRMLRSSINRPVDGINRKGLVVPLPESLAQAVECIPCVLDGELMGSVLHVFEILEYDGIDLRDEPYEGRLRVLETVGKAFGPGVEVVATARGSEAKRNLLAKVRALGQEGIVFKRLSAPYAPGRPASGGNQFKFKLVESATFRVRAINGAKRSVELQVSVPRKDGDKMVYELLCPVGSVTIPANHTVPTVGQLVEVAYLYCFEGGSLFQPVYKGPRPDLDDSDLAVVSINQLKFKRQHEDAMAA